MPANNKYKMLYYLLILSILSISIILFFNLFNEFYRLIIVILLAIFAISLFLYYFLEIEFIKKIHLNDRISLKTKYVEVLILSCGIIVLFSFYFQYHQMSIAHDQHITNLLSNAIDNLGDEKIEIKMGGIVLLERIICASDKDCPQVTDILASYMRNNATKENYESFKKRNKDWPPNDIKRIIETLQQILNRSAAIKNTNDHSKKMNLEKIWVPNLFVEKACFPRVSFENANLESCRMPKADLRECSFCGAELQGSNLSESNLENAKLNQANLREIDLTGSNLNGAFLQLAILAKAKLSRSKMDFAELSNAKMEAADCSEATLIQADFSQAILIDTDFSRADFEGTILQGANILLANFRGAKNLTLEQLKQAKNWRLAYFDEAFLKKLHLPPDHNERLKKGDLNSYDLSDTDLSFLDLSRFLLNGANLKNANLKGSNLKNANLQNANLQNANLEDANLQNANLNKATLTGANLTNINGVTSDQLREAIR